MANLDYDYNNNDFQLINDGVSSGIQLSDGDYVRISVYENESTDILEYNISIGNPGDNINKKAIFYSSLDDTPFVINTSPSSGGVIATNKTIGGTDNNDFKIYVRTNNDSGLQDYYLKPNELFDREELPDGNYTIQVDFLKQLTPTYSLQSNLDSLPFPSYYQQFDVNDDTVVNVSDSEEWNDIHGRPDIATYINQHILDPSTYPIPTLDNATQEQISSEPFFNPYYNPQVGNLFNFIIKEISTSRKEVRLKLLDYSFSRIETDGGNLVDSFIINDIKNQLNSNTNSYQFEHMLNIGNGRHIPINNFHFDAVTDGKDNQSIILRLYEPLPYNVSNLKLVSIEKEILVTQRTPITYVSDVEAEVIGFGLNPDSVTSWLNLDGDDTDFQNYNELTSSLTDSTLQQFTSASSHYYPNLNVNYNEFENHTHFGSAKIKIVNFKNKIKTIQNYYSQISSSLLISGSVDLSSDTNSVVQIRKDLFKKIDEEINSFTPYEKFLYYDGQSESTASAPSLGKNYADVVPVQFSDDTSNNSSFSGTKNIISGKDGFNVVYEYKNNDGNTAANIDLFSSKYFVHEKPFFNYSSSIYLSYLMKSNAATIQAVGNTNPYMNSTLGFNLPEEAFHGATINNPTPTGSKYQRYIVEVSQSYWVPTENFNNESGIVIAGDFANIDNFSNPQQTAVLSGSFKTGSWKIKDSTGKYPTTVVTESGVPFYGACMPVGELFYVAAYGQKSASLITDVKITFNNPSNAQPFSELYHTSSTEWINWYNDMLTKAETFDTNNIHSLENNLPTYIQESSEYNDLKDFLSLQGEQYDVIKNHIDGIGKINDRGYKKLNSPAENIYPILLNNLGYEAINPFSGSLEDSLASYLSGVTSIDDIKNNTWRKTLNNLLYIYKSKGTKNSVRALLNVYGYPPDIIPMKEYGGTTEQLSDTFETNPNPAMTTDTDIGIQTGSIQFIGKKEKLHNYIFGGRSDRKINLDWWMDSANINTIEFVYKHTNTTQRQTILQSSGSGNQKLWDLTLVPSSDGVSSSFEFRLNNTISGSSAIASNAVSMSTSYKNISNGQLWNVMLQRMTASVSGSGTNEYRLHSSLQNNTSILNYTYVTMSVSGGIAVDGNHIANQNFISSGSRHQLSSSNLVVGEVFSGSLSEIKAWSSALSKSKFRLHTLNKFSTTGNTINSHKEELIYHFRLNENYSSASVSASGQSLTIVDSSPTTNFSDYSFQRTGSFYTNPTSSMAYSVNIIDAFSLGLQDNNLNSENNSNIIISPPQKHVGNLNPFTSIIKNKEKKDFYFSNKLEIGTSPTDKVNQYILNKMDNFNFEKYYGNPIYQFSSSYTELDTLRKNFFESFPIEVDTNKFIRGHENIFNNSMVDGLKKLVPASSTLSDRDSGFEVIIKPNLLEKPKYRAFKHSVETNPNTATGSIVFVENTEYKQQSLVSNLELPYSASLSMGNAYSASRDYIHSPFLQPDGITGSIDFPKSGSSISVNENILFSTTQIEFPYSSSISMGNNYQTGSYKVPIFLRKGGITGSVILPYSSSINFISTHFNKSYVDIHKNWGTGADKTHFINFAGGTGSNNNYNVGHIDTRFTFNSIGDCEHYSSSYGKPSDFSDSSRFYNRIIVTENLKSDVQYDSKGFGTGSGIFSGIMMGKTRYYSTASDGSVLLPNNHVSRYVDHFVNNMRNGTQNTNPGFFPKTSPDDKAVDHSTASFYRVNVTGGENQIIIKGDSSPNLDNKGNVTY